MVDVWDWLAGAGGQSAGEGKGKVLKTDKAMPGIRGVRSGYAHTRMPYRGTHCARSWTDWCGSPKTEQGRCRPTSSAWWGCETLAGAPALPRRWPVLLKNEPSHVDLWVHQRATLLSEMPSIIGDAADVGATSDSADMLSRLLRKCVALEEDHAKRLYKSKPLDDARGAKVVLAAKEEAGKVQDDVRLVEEALRGSEGARSRL
ncbi:hypothetical protein ACHAWF_017163 [Thalassiosira exigua]